MPSAVLLAAWPVERDAPQADMESPVTSMNKPEAVPLQEPSGLVSMLVTEHPASKKQNRIIFTVPLLRPGGPKWVVGSIRCPIEIPKESRSVQDRRGSGRVREIKKGPLFLVSLQPIQFFMANARYSFAILSNHLPQSATKINLNYFQLFS